MLDKLIIDVLEGPREFLFYDPCVGPSQRKDFAEEVTHQLARLHPAELAQILLEVQAAKETRYSAPHPDYYVALSICLERERKPKQPFARLTSKDAEQIINEQKSWLQDAKAIEGW